MDFFLQRRFFLFHEQKVFFRVFADAPSVNVFVIRQRALVFTGTSTELAHEPRFRVCAFMRCVRGERLILGTANVTLKIEGEATKNEKKTIVGPIEDA